MRKKIIFSIGAMLVVSILIFALVRGNDSEKDINEDASHVEYDENQILIINRTVNFAEGYQDEGIFIDVKGRVYFYCFSQLIYNLNELGTDVQFLEKLKDIQKYADPVMTIEESVISEAVNLCFEIDTTEAYETKLAAYDAGSRKLYICNGNNMISCRESGDYVGALDSASAIKFMEYFDNTLLPAITSFCEHMTEEEYAGVKAYYYTEDALYFENIHCGF